MNTTIPPKLSTRGRQETAVHVSLDSLPITVKRIGDTMDIRADWKRVKWERYTRIGEGIREVVAVGVQLALEDVSVVCSLFIAKEIATARLTIDLPSTHQSKLASEDVQKAIEDFLSEVKFGSCEAGLEQPHLGPPIDRCDPEPAGVVATPAGIRGREAQIREIARRTRAVIGGCTLRVPCEIESAAWGRKFEVSGKLAAKPRIQVPTPVIVSGEFTIDGGSKRDSFVNLQPLNSPLELHKVAYDEPT